MAHSGNADSALLIIMQCKMDLGRTSLSHNHSWHLEQWNVINGTPQALKDHYRTAYGINRKSILTECPHFDMIKQTPADVVHVLLEGVIPLTLQALIKYYIKT